VYRIISVFLLILPLSSGIVMNMSFLPSLYSLFLLLNPLYVHLSLFTSLYLKDSCELSMQPDSLFNDSVLCQNLIMSFFGFDFYGDQSSALVLLFLWILFLNTVAILALYLTTLRPRGVVFKTSGSVKEMVQCQREVVATSTSFFLEDNAPAPAAGGGGDEDSELLLEESTLSSRDTTF
jgi:hypothetical protein